MSNTNTCSAKSLQSCPLVVGGSNNFDNEDSMFVSNHIKVLVSRRTHPLFDNTVLHLIEDLMLFLLAVERSAHFCPNFSMDLLFNDSSCIKATHASQDIDEVRQGQDLSVSGLPQV